jgi:hypothetical protein
MKKCGRCQNAQTTPMIRLAVVALYRSFRYG